MWFEELSLAFHVCEEEEILQVGDQQEATEPLRCSRENECLKGGAWGWSLDVSGVGSALWAACG